MSRIGESLAAGAATSHRGAAEQVLEPSPSGPAICPAAAARAEWNFAILAWDELRIRFPVVRVDDERRRWRLVIIRWPGFYDGGMGFLVRGCVDGMVKLIFVGRVPVAVDVMAPGKRAAIQQA